MTSLANPKDWEINNCHGFFLQQQMNMFGGMPPMGMMGPGPSNMGYQNMRNFPPYGMVGCVY